MRLQVEVHPDDQEPLRRLAVPWGYPSQGAAIRLAAAYLLHLKIREEFDQARVQADAPEPAAEVA